MPTARKLRSVPAPPLDRSPLENDQTAEIPATENLLLAQARHSAAEGVTLSNLYKSILDHIPAGIVTLEPPDFRVVQVNDCYRQFLDNPPAEIVGVPLAEMVPSEGFKTVLPLYERVIETGEAVNFVDLPFEGHRRGTTYWTGSYVPIRDGTGRVAYVLLLLVDTTRRKKAEDLLLSRNEDIRALSEALEREKEKLEAILGAVGDPVCMIAPDFRVIWANKAYLELYGNTVGWYCYRECRKTTDVCPGCPAVKVFETGETVTAVSESWDKCGRWLSVELTATPLHDANGDVVAVVEATHDITERLAMEDQLRRRNRELEALSSVAKALSQPLEATEIVSLALEKAMEVLGVEIGMVYLLSDDGGLLEMLAYRGLSDQRVAEIRTILPRQGLTGRAVRSGDVVLMEDADEDVDSDPAIMAIVQGARIQSGTSIPLKSKSRVLGVMNLFSRTEHLLTPKDAELLSSIGGEIGVAIENGMLFGQLAKTTEDAKLKALKLQSVLTRNFSIQECERTRIARDLHDGVTQLISGALRHVEASAAVGGWEGGEPEGFQNLESAKTLLQQSIDEIHAAIFDLSPPIVELGLVAAIQNYVKLYKTSFGIECHLHISGGVFRDSSCVERGVYRIIQEALQNVEKHAEATKVEVLLDFGATELKVVVKDDGKGLRQKEGVEEWHLGLMSMQERALSIGGHLEIRNLPGHGTQLILGVPRDNASSTSNES